MSNKVTPYASRMPIRNAATTPEIAHMVGMTSTDTITIQSTPLLSKRTNHVLIHGTLRGVTQRRFTNR